MKSTENSPNSFELNTTFEDTIKIAAEQAVDTFLRENKELKFNGVIVINYSNKNALDYNLAIRAKLFSDRMQIEAGDILLINQNNYNYDPELLNGMLVKVLTVSAEPELKSGMKSYDQNGNDCQSPQIQVAKVTRSVRGGECRGQMHDPRKFPI